MVEHRDGKTVLVTPVRREDVSSLKTGDVIYIDGLVMTGRDSVHARVVKENIPLPLSLEDGVLFHAGPIVRKNEDGEYTVVASGPTTSMRMEKYEKEFIEKTNVRVIIGKGGMGERTTLAAVENGIIHCVFPAGCAVTASSEIERVEGHYWDELTMAEMIWLFRVKEFGPLVVSIDTNGGNLFAANRKIIDERKEKVKKNLRASLDFLK